jgi:hypothetical protein
MKAVNGHKFADEELAFLAEGCRDDPIVALRQHCARLCINLDKALTRIEELEGLVESMRTPIKAVGTPVKSAEFPLVKTPVLMDFGDEEEGSG